MKNKIIIVHGWGGSSQDDWMPWATTELEKLGHEVVCRDFPDTDNPTIEKWVSFLSDIAGDVDKNTYFIGHSIGCQTIMRYLEKGDTKVGGAIFVAGWFDLQNLPDDEQVIAQPWLETPIDTNKVRERLGSVTTILGENDEVVPYDITKEKFEKLLNSKIITIPTGGHMTADDGFGPFPQLIAVIK